jgi:hypothetical protein
MDPPPLYKFQIYEDLKRFVQTWAEAHGYKLPTGTSKPGKNVYFNCSLAGEDRNKPDTTRQRLSRNKRTGCKFSISAHKPTAKARAGDPWEIRLKDHVSHNHGPMETQYEVLNRRVDPQLETEALRMASLGMQPRAVAMMLSTEAGRHVTCRTVYNITAAHKREKRKGNTPMEYLIQCLKTSNWIHDEAYDDNGQLLYLWFAHPGSVDLARRFHHVVLMDCTYKTNLNGYPLLHVVGQSATNSTFSIAFCFMRYEHEVAYSWVMNKLR